MEYEIIGTPFPAVICRLNENEAIHCQSDGMSWMSPNMEMETRGGGLGKMFPAPFRATACSKTSTPPTAGA